MENQQINIQELNARIEKESEFIEIIRLEMQKVIVGQKHLIDTLLIGLLADGHILLEGVPGLAKTLAINTLSSIINAGFNRIQFTPDLLPADLIGTMIYSQKQEEFLVKKGPIFSNFILADEINRSPAKVQSALLEAMQERQVTIGEETFKLAKPFMVLATQNPIEQEGTYPLPEAQVDRFMLKAVIGYPSREEERLIIRENIGKTFPTASQAVTIDTILQARKSVRDIHISDKIENYILDIVFATRNPEKFGMPKLKNLINFGASPRASINLALASKALAFIRRRGYVFPEDIKIIAHDVLRHRIGLSYEADAENISQDDIINTILNTIEVP